MRVNGAHRAYLDADAAAVALVWVGLWLHFEDIDGVSRAVTGRIVRPDRVLPADRRWGLIGPCGQFVPDGVRKCACLAQVIRVRPPGRERPGKGVLPDKGRTRNGVKTVCLQNIAQFD